MKYIPTWLPKNWARINGFKGKTKRHSVDYDRTRDERLVHLEGDFDREDLIKIRYELEINYAQQGLFTEEANKRILKGEHRG